MTTSRRSFLTKGSLLALAASVPVGLSGVASAAEKITATSSSDATLSKAAFLNQINTNFVIRSAGNAVTTKLVKVVDLPGTKARPNKEGFSLLFQGDRSKSLQQQTYEFEHAKLGKFSLLLVPASHEDKGSQFYEVVINRLYP